MPAGRNLTKDEVIATIRDLAAKLERRPSMAEICVALQTSIRQVRKVFATYAQAVEAAGLDPTQGGHLTVEELFQDWIGVTRKVGRIPTVYDYEKESRYSLRPLQWRFGSWKLVPGAMLQFGDQRQCWAGWEDVRGIMQAHVDAQKAAREAKLTSTGAEADANLTYGEPLTSGPLAVAPTQEMGVMLLFGWLARHLGFVVLKTQNIFPDCEALRRLEDRKWMRVWIEFEFESRNFLVHGHDAGGCDLIVCWEHNWADCPLEVIELRKMVGKTAPEEQRI